MQVTCSTKQGQINWPTRRGQVTFNEEVSMKDEVDRDYAEAYAASTTAVVCAARLCRNITGLSKA